MRETGRPAESKTGIKVFERTASASPLRGKHSNVDQSSYPFWDDQRSRFGRLGRPQAGYDELERRAEADL